MTMHHLKVTTEEAQHAAKATLTHSSLSLEERKAEADPPVVRGWPVEPQLLRGSIRAQPLNTTGDIILILFPLLSLGMNLPGATVSLRVADSPAAYAVASVRLDQQATSSNGFGSFIEQVSKVVCLLLCGSWAEFGLMAIGADYISNRVRCDCF